MKHNILLALLCVLALGLGVMSAHAETITNTDVLFTSGGAPIANEYIYNDGLSHTITLSGNGTSVILGSSNPASPARMSVSNGGDLSLIGAGISTALKIYGDFTHSSPTTSYSMQFNDGTLNITGGMDVSFSDFISVYSGDLNVLDGVAQLQYGPGLFRHDGTGSLVTTVGAAGEVEVGTDMTCAADFSTFYGSHVSIQAAPGLALHFEGTTITTLPVPEPGTIALLCGGLFGLIAYAWRKRR